MWSFYNNNNIINDVLMKRISLSGYLVIYTQEALTVSQFTNPSIFMVFKILKISYVSLV